MKVIQKLEDDEVVSFSLNNDKKSMNVMECCDFYYQANLTKIEVRSLLIELDFLYQAMKD